MGLCALLLTPLCGVCSIEGRMRLFEGVVYVGSVLLEDFPRPLAELLSPASPESARGGGVVVIVVVAAPAPPVR